MGELAAGRGPVYADMSWGSEEDQAYMLWAIDNEGSGTGFLHLNAQYGLDFRRHKIELWPIEPEHSAAAAGGPIVDDTCQTTLPGLYAAGDEAGGIPGSVAPGAFTMGYLAAESAAAFAKTRTRTADRGDFEPLVAFCVRRATAREAIPGRKPRPDPQHHDRLQRAVPIGDHGRQGTGKPRFSGRAMRLTAANPHELTHCLEIRNLIDCGKIIFRSTIERKESRYRVFSRLDCPERDDANFFCFLGQRLDAGQVRFRKHMMS